ncbi:hypothetical protein [Albibacterium indicum]|uniref:hypothetical protein n=1 Tax=Albibacterium indicum TaxID=2292082 RepID=UPI000E4C926D|nr:hypothetical protein [Pedobacter indicus]
MSQHYDILYIQQYLEGKLSPDEMHDLERAALNDNLLQDAIDGYRSADTVDHRQLSLLQKRFAARIENHQEIKNRNYFTWQRLTIASIAGLLFIVIGVLFWMMRNPATNREDVTKQQATAVSVQEKVTINLVEGNLFPKVGWDAFRDHVSISTVAIPTGEHVTVHFDVKDTRPINIRFVSSHDEQLIDTIEKMLEKGPGWDGSSGTIELQF